MFWVLSKLHDKLNGRPDLKRLVQNGLKLGTNVHIGPHVIIDDSYCWLITVGDDCTLAPRVHILAHDASTKKGIGYTKIGVVTIGARTFIGAGSMILPGVTIGADVIIGAGSVVSHDVPAGSVASGNPAVVVGQTNEYFKKHERKISEGAPVCLVETVNEVTREQIKEAVKDRIGYFRFVKPPQHHSSE